MGGPSRIAPEPSTKSDLYAVNGSEFSHSSQTSTTLTSIRIVPRNIVSNKSNYASMNQSCLKNIFSCLADADLFNVMKTSKHWSMVATEINRKRARSNYALMPIDWLKIIFSCLADVDLFEVMKTSRRWRMVARQFGWTTALKHRFPLFNLKKTNLPYAAYNEYSIQKISSLNFWKNEMDKTEDLSPLDSFFFRSLFAHAGYIIAGSIYRNITVFSPSGHFGFAFPGCVDYSTISNNHLIVASTNFSADTKQYPISIIDLQNRKVIKHFHIKGRPKTVRNPILNCNHGKLAMIAKGTDIVIIDLIKNMHKTLYPNLGSITCLANWQNKYIVIGHFSGEILIVNMISDIIFSQIHMSSAIIDMSVTNDTLFTCDANKNVNAYNLSNSRHLYFIPAEYFFAQEIIETEANETKEEAKDDRKVEIKIDELDTYHFAKIQSWGNRVVTISYDTRTKDLLIHTWLIHDPDPEKMKEFKNRIMEFRIPNYFKNGYKHFNKIEITPLFDMFIVQPLSPFNYDATQIGRNRILLQPILVAPFKKQLRLLPEQIISIDSNTHTLASYFGTGNSMINEGMTSFPIHDRKANILELRRKAFDLSKKKLITNIIITIAFAATIIFLMIKGTESERV